MLAFSWKRRRPKSHVPLDSQGNPTFSITPASLNSSMYDYHPLIPAIIFFYFTKKIKDFRRKQATYTMVSTINSEEGCNLFVNLRKTVCTVVLPREGTPRPIGWGFCAVLVQKGYRFCPFCSGIGCGFRGNCRSVWTYLSFQFQMSKKEREICEFEMDFKNFWICALI